MPDSVTGQTGTVIPSSDDPRIGSTLTSRYRIIAPLGEGGMGTVYRGVHEALRKPVAIKFLQQKIHGNREMVARFEREAVTAANLRHPNIAEAIDYGSLPDGTLYLVMELVEGVPLRKLIQPGQGMPLERVLHILEQIAAALDLAHSMGIVHRDLKPENILVFDRGTMRDVVKIIDFGIARITSEMFKAGPTALTAAGSVFGTPQYMAPEQVMGQPVDARADQYAIGVITFEMVTGSQPFTADTYSDLVMKHVGADVPRTSEFVPHVSAAVDAAIFRMMSKLPEERFESVTDALRAMKGENSPQSLRTNSAPMSASTVVMGSSTASPAAGSKAASMEFAATMLPGEQPPLPQLSQISQVSQASQVSQVSQVSQAVTPPPMRSEVSSAIKVNEAALTAPPPEQAIPTPAAMPTPQQPPPTAAPAPAKPPMALIGGLCAVIVVLLLVVVFFVARSPDASKSDDVAQANNTANTARANPTSLKTSLPTSTPAPTRPVVTNTKYRFLLKDGKEPYCVTSKLKKAYPVRTNEEGVKVCVGTPEGPIPVDSLKVYQVSEMQWE